MKINLSVVFLSLSLIGFSSCTKKESLKDVNLYIDIGNEYQSRYTLNVKDYQWNFVHYGNQTSGDMFVDGTDIYYPAYNGYYKNGVLVTLPQAEGIQCVYVKNGDIYAAGNRTPWGASYWKNGELFKLEPDSSNSFMAPLQIIVGYHAVYIAGQYREGSAEGIAYWKNGILHRLPNGQYGARFAGMAVKGSDVYIAGQSQEVNSGVGVYWKNEEKHYIYNHDNTRPNGLTSVRAFNGDIYITGGGSGPLYWKNDIPVGESGVSNLPKDIFVDKNDIYVTGTFMLPYSSGPVYSVTLWKNGNFDTVAQGISRKFAGGQ